MRLECECCGESFILKARQLKHVITKTHDEDCDIGRDVIICPLCGGTNNVGDNILWEAKNENKRKK